MKLRLLFALFLATSLYGQNTIPPSQAEKRTPGDALLTDYFRNEALSLSQRSLTNITTLEDWTTNRAEYRRQLQEMLGLWPMPERGDLKAVVTGRLTNDDFIMEKIYYQASPQLYCTANLFLPRHLTNPAPTILYECGHWRLMTNGISYGNKAVYQMDGAWLARNGYVCMVVDTVLAGEITGIHTGTRDNGLWWWNSRGYTPAGVEAWFGIRALDYLCTRSEVDTNRFGITGHSGGGAYSWTVTALDDRIKVAAPLAGMADVQSHMLDGVIDSHCDCNFFINIYHWDFPQVAALAAPRPLLIGGTDHDGLFLLDNTERLFGKVRRLYQLYNKPYDIGLAMAPGVHDEVPELRLAVVRWFNRYLKGVTKETETPIVVDSKKFFTPAEVKVFDTLPADSINSNIASYFVPMAAPTTKTPDKLRAELREKVFSAWPDEATPLNLKQISSTNRNGCRYSVWEFTSEHDVPLRLYLAENPKTKPLEIIHLGVAADNGTYSNSFRTILGLFGEKKLPEFSAMNTEAGELERMAGQHYASAFFAPRGLGMDEYSGDNKRLTRIRRRYMLVGQTLDGMRVWDIRRAVQALQAIEKKPIKIAVNSEGNGAVNSLYAALFEPQVSKLELTDAPSSQAETGPDYLGVLKVTDLPQVEEAVRATADLTIR